LELFVTKTASDPGSLDYWKNPAGVEIPGDPLKFLYISDEAEHRMVSRLAQRVFEYQRANAGTERQITKMVMITMGALLPGVLLQDYVAHCAAPDMPPVEFGTFGVKCYYGPGQPLEQPEIVQPLSIEVRGQTVGVVEDLIDLGGTARFVTSVLCSPEYGAREVVIIAPYRKSAAALPDDIEVISFGVVPRHTWIITPRERVETMVKRVPFWAGQGASRADCIQNLRCIGYPEYLINDWFEAAWAQTFLPHPPASSP
jgi:hypoxanthine-guanine phosphoribosyltransferase